MDDDSPRPEALARESRCRKILAFATVAVLLLATFDVSRALYCSVRLHWAVEHFATTHPATASSASTGSASLKQAEAVERVRRLSGLHDLALDALHVERSAPPLGREPRTASLTVSARYPVDLLSPSARAYFGRRSVSVAATETFALASTNFDSR